MFVQALEDLVARTGAEYAVFCDYEGEAIALASRQLDPFEVRLVGAQVGAAVFALLDLTGDGGAALSCVVDQRSLLIEALPGKYYLLLSLPRGALEPVARRSLREVARRFRSEL